MKTNKLTLIIGSCCMALALLTSLNAVAQSRKLPDGSVVYSNGTRKLPNGTVIYSNGTQLPNKASGVILPNGDGSYNRKNRIVNGHRLPPGQAKKLYGGSAKDYAPGQQKKWNDDFKKNKKQGKGHKD